MVHLLLPPGICNYQTLGKRASSYLLVPQVQYDMPPCWRSNAALRSIDVLFYIKKDPVLELCVVTTSGTAGVGEARIPAPSSIPTYGNVVFVAFTMGRTMALRMPTVSSGLAYSRAVMPKTTTHTTARKRLEVDTLDRYIRV